MRSQIVDGVEALVDACYRLSDSLWIDPALPADQFRGTVEQWIRSKKRNLWDRVPALDLERTSKRISSFFAFPSDLSGLLGLLKERRAGPGAVVHLTGEKLAIDDLGEMRVFVSGNLQEAADFAALAHLEALARPQTILHLFDGERLPKELEKIGLLTEDGLRRLAELKTRDFADLLRSFSEMTGRSVDPLEYIGHPEADRVLVAMGPAAGPIEEAVRSRSRDEKIGFLKIRLLSPFDSKAFVEKIPGSVQTVFTLEQTTLTLKVLNALHEGMVNRWSWFAALPRLVKFKSAQQALSLAGLSPFTTSEDISIRWERLAPDGGLGLARELLTLLAADHYVQAKLRDEGSTHELHARVSNRPFLSNEDVASPDILFGPPPSGQEAEPTRIATALLKACLSVAEQKGIPLDGEVCRKRWKEALEEHYRPFGPHFVQTHTQAIESIWNGGLAGENEPSSPPTSTTSASFIAPLALNVQGPKMALMATFEDAVNKEEALVLPLIREQSLHEDVLKSYQDRMKGLSFQAARRPFADRPFGLGEISKKIRRLGEGLRCPLIARLAARSLDGWVLLATDLQEAGVAALEITFEDGQNRAVVVRRLKGALSIPLFVSLRPGRENLQEIMQLRQAGADGFVLFQELPQKDFNVSTRTWREMMPPPGLSHRLEVLDGLQRLKPQTDLPLIAHGGFSTEEDVAKALALGARWVQVASA